MSRVDDVAVRRNCMVAWISSVAAEASAAEVLSSLPQTELKNDSSGIGGDSDSRSPSDNYSGSYNIVSNLVASTTNIFLSQPILAHPSAGVEDLQVLEYGVGGEFVFHHDGEPRILTVIYYLNGVGGTWFPLASVDDNADGINGKERVNNHHCVEQLKNKAQAMELIKDLIPGNDGLLVKGGHGEQQQQQLQSSSSKDDHVVWINKGDAIAFYNYLDDGSARLDWRSIHCGLPTTKEDGAKWIANHWYRLNVLEEDVNN